MIVCLYGYLFVFGDKHILRVNYLYQFICVIYIIYSVKYMIIIRYIDFLRRLKEIQKERKQEIKKESKK